jgi:hypothetical protein
MLTLYDCNRSQQTLQLQRNSVASWIIIVRTYDCNRGWLPSQLSPPRRRLWFHRATTMKISHSLPRCNRVWIYLPACRTASPWRQWWWHRPDNARFGLQVRHIDASGSTAPMGSWRHTKTMSLVVAVGGSYRWWRWDPGGALDPDGVDGGGGSWRRRQRSWCRRWTVEPWRRRHDPGGSIEKP